MTLDNSECQKLSKDMSECQMKCQNVGIPEAMLAYQPNLPLYGWMRGSCEKKTPTIPISSGKLLHTSGKIHQFLNGKLTTLW